MGLNRIQKVLAVGGHIHRMVESGIGQADIPLPIQADAVQLQLHRVVAIVGHVVDVTCLFIDLQNVGHFEFVVGQRGQQFTTQFVKVNILPAGALAIPKGNVYYPSGSASAGYFPPSWEATLRE